MEFTVEASPEEVIAKTEVYLTACAYTIENRAPATITGLARRRFSWILGIFCILDPMTLLGQYLSLLLYVEQKVSVSATIRHDGTVIVTSGSEESRLLLEDWIRSGGAES